MQKDVMRQQSLAMLVHTPLEYALQLGLPVLNLHSRNTYPKKVAEKEG